ncbi:phenylacetate-CoA oxygenase/reductase subunit PaaK [Flavihumibacter rivuli]|uniref:1,2-phenylacetyl-CoA epoxidase subunit PaaE n=1 Tax=Flavihumibacter rivuli TaxID=2838156 RepID=UPI001BDF0F7A|nr:1,2-phenylacetyl-CoA epoxidase subunit PaaE [Flavihumibacter rivuli]ULQ55300.1 phenylacetate-CoA oxygenase/reductase subunit PaaK [Flavihumibacter rivuli]
MSIHFHPLTISDIRRETNECVSIAFDIPEELKETFRFREGQNITIKATIDGEEIRRSYSVCSSPLEGELRVAVKQVEGGKFSTFANKQLQKGQQLDVLPPTGKFYTELNPSHHHHYVAFAAGSGITPILSIIKTVLATEPNSSFTLVYGNKNRNAIIFRETLEAIKNKYINRFRIIHVLSRERTDAAINHGRIDADKCEQLGSQVINWPSVHHYFLCGPEAMIFSTRDFLVSKGVPAEKIHFELFTSPGQAQRTREMEKADAKDTGPVARVSVKLDGISFDFDLPFNSRSILDAALQEGADLPYACKGGVCCTCRAKLVSGEVEMEVNYALEPDEVAAGYILTCQSHPRSGSVVVDFDSK